MTKHLEKYKWEKGMQSPNKNGRPKSLKTILNSEYAMTQTQCNEAILSILAMSKQQVEIMADDSESAMFFRIIGKALLKSHQNSSLYVLESLLNRSFGKPKEQKKYQYDKIKEVNITLDI